MIIWKNNLTPHFSAAEYFPQYREQNTYLTEESYLFARILEETRVDVGLRFYVNSWYRTQAQNKAVGGISSSNHLRGCAADIHTKNKITRKRFIKIVLAFKKNCRKHGRVGEAGLYENFIHLGIQSETQKAVNGGKFIQWDERTGERIYNNILEVQD